MLSLIIALSVQQPNTDTITKPPLPEMVVMFEPPNPGECKGKKCTAGGSY